MNRDFYEDDVPEREETNNKKEEDEYNDNEFDDYNEKEENNEENSIPNVKKDEEEEEYNDKEFEDFNEESIKEENKEQDVQANNIKNNKTITYSIPPQPNPIIIQSNQHYSGFNKVNEIMKNKQNQNTHQIIPKASCIYYNEKYDTYEINKKPKAVTIQQTKHINPLYFPHRTTKDSKLNKLLKNYYADYRKLMKNNTIYHNKTKKDEVDYYPTISPIDFKNKKKKIAKMLCDWNEDYDFTLLLFNDDLDIKYSNESSLYDNNIDNVLVRNDFARRITRMTEEPYVEDNNNLYQIKENGSKYEDEYQSLDKKEHSKTASLPKEINRTIHTEEEEQKEDDSKENTIEEEEKPTIISNKTKTTIQNAKKSNDGYSKTIDKEDNDDEAMKLYEQFERKTLSDYLNSNKHIIC